MNNFQIKINISDKKHIRQALKASGRDDDELFDRLQGSPAILALNDRELELVNKSLENAIERENNWVQAQFYRETYGKVLSQTNGANAKDDDFDRDGSVSDQSSQTNDSHRAL